MELEKIEKLMQLMKQYELNEIELKENDSLIKLTSSNVLPNTVLSTNQLHLPSTPIITETNEAPLKSKENTNLKEICSPFVGTFFRSPSPTAKCFVEKEGFVKKGSTLCIVEAMKLMNEIKAPADGIIKKIFVENENPVEYNQPLFLLELK